MLHGPAYPLFSSLQASPCVPSLYCFCPSVVVPLQVELRKDQPACQERETICFGQPTGLITCVQEAVLYLEKVEAIKYTSEDASSVA